ncbi:MAG: hypothetical protein SGARI_000454 [Bacillariaceae sp.]
MDIMLSPPAAAAAPASTAAAAPSPDSTGMQDGNNNFGNESPTMDASKKRRKDLFGDCALVEIIHLHDCLRGALHALEKDLIHLSQMVLQDSSTTSETDGDNVETKQTTQEKHFLMLSELESRATARFQVIWSVFRAHSAAEDEFIWPALRLKTQGRVQGCCNGSKPNCSGGGKATSKSKGYNSADDDEVVEQEEYEEDHADEERMFTMMDHLLTRLRKGLLTQRKQYQRHQQRPSNVDGVVVDSSSSPKTSGSSSYNHQNSITDTMKEIQSLVKTLNQHLMVHLEKEEKQCMPLVVKHLSKSEIHDLVGKIMGKRSSDMIAQILTMAVQNLNEDDKEEMVKHMKQAMVGTFFDRWLAASGWMDGIQRKGDNEAEGASTLGNKRSVSPSVDVGGAIVDYKRSKSESSGSAKAAASIPGEAITSQAELEKLIRAVATNPSLSGAEKNVTIQGLRTSVWKRNQRLLGNSTMSDGDKIAADLFPPSSYYQKNEDGSTVLVWKAPPPEASDDVVELDSAAVPKFLKSDMEPTFHGGSEAGQVLGCAHYARACKIRHPLSGRLYTCRLCCDQERDGPGGEKDEPLDRYAVSEVSCMKCKTLQPAAKTCINGDCELHKQGFAKYYCDICHLYDDRPRPIFHCPYCNTCRSGQGLGIDYRHCMRCNACVSLADDNHRCIPQKLQGSCPICHETLFSSTEPLRGLRCGHVMHLSCFTDYRRGQNYTCPLCMRSMEDMSDYFSLLDQAVRTQTMPAMYQNTFCNLYCQDCDKTGQCRYHFVGQKCPHCGSYNTREMGRFEAAAQGTS